MKILLALFACLVMVGCVKKQVEQFPDDLVFFEIKEEEIVLFEKPQPKPKAKVNKEKQLEEFIEVNNERRRLPFHDNGQWNYTNIQNGKPVNTSHKLSL